MATTKQLPIPHLTTPTEPFLKLWPHRFDFLYAEYPDPKTSPEWKTERKYPLDDRILIQGDKLYGVRFGQTTAYTMLDIDYLSPYHPQQDPQTIRRIQQAMESIGLVTSIVCTSSDSQGIHIYFPFVEDHKSWEIGLAVTTLLERQGLKIKPGQLEVFPNARPYSPGLPQLFNGHRLPMNAGSYILDADFNPIFSNWDSFADRWQQTQERNQLDTTAIKRILKTRSRKFSITTSAEKFLNDLNAVIQEGWTDHGQTNHILGKIAMRSYIFGHVLYADRELEGEALVQDIIKIAKHLPGYEEWCGHKHDLADRAEEWARCIEGSKYFHYGRKEIKISIPEETKEPTGRDRWNQAQSEAARERIRSAIADLLEKGELKARKTDRFNQLITYGIGGATLYKHKDLWDIKIQPEENLENDRSLLPAEASNYNPELGSSDQNLDGEADNQAVQGSNSPSRLDDWALPSDEGGIEQGGVMDLSELLVEIQIMQVQLDWSREDLAIYIAENFGGRKRSQLKEEELIDLAEMLERLVTHFEGVP